MASPNDYARLSGALYLAIAVLAMFAYFYVFGRLVIEGDAAATAANIAGAAPLFRLGFFAYLVTLVLDVLVAWALYVLLRPASPTAAMLAAWMRLIYVVLHGAALLNLTAVLRLLDIDPTSDAAAQAMLAAIEAHLDGFMISLAIFGAHLLVLAWLIHKSGFLPKALAFPVALAGAAYVADTTLWLLFENYEQHKSLSEPIVAVAAMLGEFSLLLWLLLRGVDTQRWREAANSTA